VRRAADRVRRLSTDDVDPQRALAYWVDSVGRTLLELDIDTARREAFRATLQQSEFGPGRLNFIEASEQWMQRTRQSISRSRSSASFHLLQLRRGEFALSQYAREVTIRAGECVLIDSKEPCRLTCPRDTACISLEFPQPWLQRWLPDPEAAVARRLPRRGWGAALARALECLAPDKVEELALPSGQVAEEIAALLALSLGRGSASVAHKPKLLEQLKRTLQDRHHEPDLDPGAVATAHGIGKRYLHALFAQEGTSFGEELIAARLQSAQRMLADRRFSNLPIGEIAARCGFVDPSHFARRFRKRHQVGPAAFRRDSVWGPQGGAEDD